MDVLLPPLVVSFWPLGTHALVWEGGSKSQKITHEGAVTVFFCFGCAIFRKNCIHPPLNVRISKSEQSVSSLAVDFELLPLVNTKPRSTGQTTRQGMRSHGPSR